MKYSFNLGQTTSSTDLSKIRELTKVELAEKLNSQIGAFDEIIDWSKRYEGIYVVNIVSVEEHPNADKLQVCLIDDGGVAQDVERNKDGLVQVVCGAPNAKEGLSVVWITPGSIVPSTFSEAEPFKLSVAKLRGIESSGMLASPKELALSQDHEGVIELDATIAKPGAPFKDLLDLDDVIVDFENKMFTHRPDCFGHLGIAREVAGIQGLKFSSPDWYRTDIKLPEAQSKLQVKVDNQVPELVPRYLVVPIEGVKIEPSPLWLQSYLTRLGIKAINNVVDITNYMMVLTGQPMHAFDFDKVATKNDRGTSDLVLRTPIKGDSLKVLSGKELSFDPEKDSTTILICDEQKPVDLAGMMGGANSEVDAETTRIILESANFDMYSVRRTSMRHGIFTDAVTRFTKGQSPEQTEPVLVKAMSMLKELVPSVKFGKVVDLNTQKDRKLELQTSAKRVNALLGTALSTEQIIEILNRVELQAKLSEKGMIKVTIPFWRQDLELEEDLIEEVGRLYGFNKIVDTLPVRPAIPARKNKLVDLKKEVRKTLSNFGANEVLTYNFVNSKLLERAGQDPDMAYKIRNALSPDLQAYRLSLAPNLIEKVHANIKAGTDELALFELGKCHIKGHLESEAGLPAEFQRLAFVYANKQGGNGSPFFTAKRYLSRLLQSLGLEYRFVELKPEMFGQNIPITSVYQTGRTAGVEIAGELRGVVGEFDQVVSKNFKLPSFSAGFEVDLAWMADKFSPDANYQPLSKYPSLLQDLTLESPVDQTFAELEDELLKRLSDATNDSGVEFKISPVSIYQKSPKSNKATTFSIEFWNPQKTLTSSEVKVILEKVG